MLSSGSVNPSPMRLILSRPLLWKTQKSKCQKRKASNWLIRVVAALSLMAGTSTRPELNKGMKSQGKRHKSTSTCGSMLVLSLNGYLQISSCTPIWTIMGRPWHSNDSASLEWTRGASGVTLVCSGRDRFLSIRFSQVSMAWYKYPN